MELKGGDKLTRVLKEIGDAAKGSVRVGFLEDATYPDGTKVAAVAFWNEFGHGGQFPAPPRPFFRNMIEAESGGWPKLLAGMLKYQDYDGEKALRGVGEIIKQQLQESIINFDAPALSPTTLMLREIYGQNPQEIRARDVLAAQQLVAEGHSGVSGTAAHPLIWTGQLKDSVDYEVNGD